MLACRTECSFRTLTLAVGFLIAAVTPLVAQQTGRITGQAVEAESQRPLVGASVMVEGTSLRAQTGENGRYVLFRVPAGAQTVTLSYIGREPVSEEVTVEPGRSTVVDFSVAVGVVALEGLEVLGLRAQLQAEALNRQKNAPNIMNIVASDQMGRFPDASAPEAVQRLPGIATARDQGEGRYIQIRGGSPANTQVNFNGVEVPSPEGEERQIALDAVPVDMLESIEVSKALLPSMDANAVGGAVNLVTRKAPSQRLLSLEASGGFAPIRDDPSGSAALTYGDRAADGRFGYIISGSYGRRNFGSDDPEPAYDFGDDPGPGDDVLEELALRNYTLWRARTGVTTNLDYRFGETSEIALTGIYSNLTDNEQRREFLNSVEDGELILSHKNREEKLRTYSVALSGNHLLSSLQLDYNLAWSRSLEDTPFDSEIHFVQEDVTFSPDISDPDAIQANPASGTIGGTYAFDEIEPSFGNTENTDRTGSVNFTLPYALGADGSGNLKFGFKYRDKDKFQEVTETAAEFNDDTELVLGDGIGGSFDGDLKYPTDYMLPPFSTSPDDVAGFVDRFGSRLDQEANVEADTEDYDLAERVAAAYVMTEMNITPRLLLLPGVRYEHTTVETDGFEFDSETEELTPASAEQSYGKVFPAVHMRYQVAERTNLRAAFTSSIARPNFFDLVPYRVRDDEDLALGNPELEPTIARSFDVLFEHYDERIGVISAGVFYKRLTDPIFVFTEENTLGGDTEQPRNGESGWIRGFELALQRQLGSGFGAYANYTYTDSEAELPSGRDARLQGQSDHVFNAALNYERGRFSGQVSTNFHADYVDEYGDEQLEDVYVTDHFQLDASANYQFTPGAAVFLELVNLTNEPFVAYQGIRERPIQQEYYGSWGRLGIRWSW